MKKIILLYCCLLLSWIGTAQICPVKTTSSGIDQFNWKAKKYNVYYQRSNTSIVLEPINAPFWETNIANSNVDGKFWQNLDDEKDYQTEDGWVLYATNFGSPTSGITVPSFALYNKYTAILRTFFYIPQKEGYSSARIELVFVDTRRSALLNHVSQPAKALDKVQEVIQRKAIVPNDWVNGIPGGFWLYADFQMAYDPCTCANISNNNTQILRIRPILMNVTEINLIGNNLPINTLPVANAGGQLANPGTSSIFNVFPAESSQADVLKAVEAGMKVYKTTGEQLENIDKVLQWFKIVPDPNAFPDENAINFNPHLPAFFKKVYPQVAAGLKIADFIATTLNTKAKASTSTSAAVASTEYRLRGYTNQDITQETFDVFNGGSIIPSGSTGSSRVPHWNNPMGVFAILETPTIDKSSTLLGYDEAVKGSPKHLYRYRLNAKNIKYVINPASGLEVVNIKSSLVLTGNDSLAVSGRIVIVPNRPPPPPVMHNNFFTYNSLNTTGSGQITNLEEGGAILDTATVKRFVRYESPYLPLTCATDYVTSFIALEKNQPKASIKVLVTLRKKGQPTAEPVVFMANYDVNVANVNSLIPMTDLSLVRRVVNITTNADRVYDPACVALNHNPIDCPYDVVAQDLDIVALEKINILGDLLPANLKFKSGGTIDVAAGANVPHNADLIIEPILNCGGVYPPANAADVSAFCANRKLYNPVATLLAGNDTGEEEERLKEIENTLTVSPNPFQQSLLVKVEVGEADNVSVELVNIIGQVVRTIQPLQYVEKGTWEFNESTADIPPCVYFIVMRSTKGGIQTQKVVKTQ